MRHAASLLTLILFLCASQVGAAQAQWRYQSPAVGDLRTLDECQPGLEPALLPAIPSSDGPDTMSRMQDGLESFTVAYIVAGCTTNTNNLTNKNYRYLNATDFVKLNVNSLPLIRSLFDFERYDLIDRIIPYHMSRAEFHRAVLRESARRGIITMPYKSRLGLTGVNEGTLVTVNRPRDVPASAERRITGAAFAVILLDAASNFLKNPTLGALVLSPDIVAEFGIKTDKPVGFAMAADTYLIDLGYTVGSMPEAQLNGMLPLQLEYGTDQQNQLQAAYCVAANEAYLGTDRVIDQNEAFSIGYLQAKMDRQTGFSGPEQSLGVFGGRCPQATRRATNADRAIIHSKLVVITPPVPPVLRPSPAIDNRPNLLSELRDALLTAGELRATKDQLANCMSFSEFSKFDDLYFDLKLDSDKSSNFEDFDEPRMRNELDKMRAFFLYARDLFKKAGVKAENKQCRRS